MESRKRRLVLHLQTRATGSAVIGAFLEQNRASLAAAPLGVLTRAELRGPINALLQAAPTQGQGPLLAKARQELALRLAALGDECPIVISSELLLGAPAAVLSPGFFVQVRERAQVLATLTEGYDTRIVLALRNQPELIEALYIESVLLGSIEPFYEFLRAFPADGLDWEAVLDSLTQCFGTVELYCYESIRCGVAALNQAFFSALCRAGSLSPPAETGLAFDVPYTPRAFSMASLRAALLAASALPPEARPAVCKFLSRPQPGIDPSPGQLIAGFVRQGILATVGESNQRLLSRYGLESHHGDYA